MVHFGGHHLFEGCPLSWAMYLNLSHMISEAVNLTLTLCVNKLQDWAVLLLI